MSLIDAFLRKALRGQPVSHEVKLTPVHEKFEAERLAQKCRWILEQERIWRKSHG